MKSPRENLSLSLSLSDDYLDSGRYLEIATFAFQFRAWNGSVFSTSSTLCPKCCSSPLARNSGDSLATIRRRSFSGLNFVPRRKGREVKVYCVTLGLRDGSFFERTLVGTLSPPCRCSSACVNSQLTLSRAMSSYTFVAGKCAFNYEKEKQIVTLQTEDVNKYKFNPTRCNVL